jgi:predicted transcriptional regulator
MQTNVKSMAIKLPQQERECLQRLGDAKKRSPHWLAKEAITQYLDREEAVEQFRQETEARWEEFCHTGKSIPHDAVMKWLESWGTDKSLSRPDANRVA